MAAPFASGIDWPAWVQAVGSVAAIAAAIWIDQGASRRQRDERRQTEIQARESRRVAVLECAFILRDLQVEASTGNLDQGQWEPSVDNWRKLWAAREVLRYYLEERAPGIPLLLVSAMAHAADVMRVVTDDLRGRTPLAGSEARLRAGHALGDAANSLQRWLRDYDQSAGRAGSSP